MRKTKLVITMGPALEGDAQLREALLMADVVRLNASHGDREARLHSLQAVRRVAEELGRSIPVFLDLQGPKWRVGRLEAPMPLVEGEVGAFYPADGPAPSGYAWAAPLPHPELFAGAKTGQTWLLDDGALSVEVQEAKPGLVLAVVRVGGLLKARKGLHPVGLDVAIDPLTEQDLEDVAWGVTHKVDFFAQSFIRQAGDVEALSARIAALGGDQPIIGKIEHPAALENLEAILEACWGIMVARGDLGVELGVERVPAIQKQIIGEAQRALKPVITATQMLESMIEHPSPTRAEASDVANAIWDGTDAVMLSAESAVGKHPLEAIRWLAKIAEDADAHRGMGAHELWHALWEEVAGRAGVAVAFAACQTAASIGAKLLVVFSEGGGSARMVSRLAGDIPVIGITADPGNLRRMMLLRGVQGMLISRTRHMSEMLASVEPILRERCGITAGDRVVMTLGHPLWTRGTTNTLRVATY